MRRVPRGRGGRYQLVGEGDAPLGRSAVVEALELLAVPVRAAVRVGQVVGVWLSKVLRHHVERASLSSRRCSVEVSSTVGETPRPLSFTLRRVRGPSPVPRPALSDTGEGTATAARTGRSNTTGPRRVRRTPDLTDLSRYNQIMLPLLGTDGGGPERRGGMYSNPRYHGSICGIRTLASELGRCRYREHFLGSER